MSVSSAALKFPTELKQIKYEVEDHARSFGLDFFKVIFEEQVGWCSGSVENRDVFVLIPPVKDAADKAFAGG